jgi:hypothetical protein
MDVRTIDLGCEDQGRNIRPRKKRLKASFHESESVAGGESIKVRIFWYSISAPDKKLRRIESAVYGVGSAKRILEIDRLRTE